jgi:hypothetical protein
MIIKLNNNLGATIQCCVEACRCGLFSTMLLRRFGLFSTMLRCRHHAVVVANLQKAVLFNMQLDIAWGSPLAPFLYCITRQGAG